MLYFLFLNGNNSKGKIISKEVYLCFIIDFRIKMDGN